MTEHPVLFDPPRVLRYPFTPQDSLAPGEVLATLVFGEKELVVLAPITKVNMEDCTIELVVVGEVADSFLISLPGEAESVGSTIQVSKRVVNGE